MFVCLALTIKMWHSIRDKLTDNWVRVDLLYTPCYGTVMKQHQYLHILSYLHFTYDRIERDRTDENFDRPKKITRPIWNSKYHIFQILQPFQKSGYWWSYCFLQREGDFHTVHNKEMEVFQHKNLQTLWTDWINVWHEIIPGKGQTAQSTALDSNSCDSDSTDEADRTWPQIIHGQFLFFTWIIWWLGEETDLLLWHCQTKKGRHATRPRTKDKKTEKGRHLHKTQSWLDSNTVVGKERLGASIMSCLLTEQPAAQLCTDIHSPSSSCQHCWGETSSRCTLNYSFLLQYLTLLYDLQDYNKYQYMFTAVVFPTTLEYPTVLNKHAWKTTTPRHSCKNIWCDLPN